MIEPLLNAVTALWFGMLGGCVGSFLNVVAYRLPLGMSVVWKPSHCPCCRHAIRARDNIPVLGWLLLRGCCRDCSQPIAARYAIVEFILGLIFFLLAYAELFRGGANLPGGPLILLDGALLDGKLLDGALLVGAIDNVFYPNWPLIGLYTYHCVLLSLLMALLLIDLDEHRVPLRLVMIGLAIGLLSPLEWPWLHPTLRVNGPILEPNGTVDLFQLVQHLLASATLGAILGAGIAAILSYLRMPACQPRTLVIAMTITGAFLGWQAGLTTTAGALAGLLMLRILLQRWSKRRASAPMIALLVAALGQIIFWDQIIRINP